MQFLLKLCKPPRFILFMKDSKTFTFYHPFSKLISPLICQLNLKIYLIWWLISILKIQSNSSVMFKPVKLIDFIDSIKFDESVVELIFLCFTSNKFHCWTIDHYLILDASAIQIFGKKSYFWEKISDFWKNFRFSEFFSDFQKIFQIFGKISDFRKKFRFSEKIQIFGKKSDFRKKIRFLEKTMTMTFREHPQRAILETCGLRLDTWHNSCDVLAFRGI